MSFKIHSAPLIAPALPKPTLQVKLRQTFSAALRKGLDPLVRNNANVPAGLSAPASVVRAYHKLLPGTEDGSLSLFKLPFGKTDHVYVVSFAGGDDTREDIFFSRSGKKMDDHRYSIG